MQPTPPIGDRSGWLAFAEQTRSLVGTREPLEILTELPGAMAIATSGLTPEQWRKDESPGRWSVLDVLVHLADTELAWTFRIRDLLTRDAPLMASFDQAAWARKLHYDAEPPEDALALLRLMRERNMRLFRRLDDAEMQRVGVHSDRGPETLESILRLMAGHDLLHIAQIARIREALGVPVPVT